MKENTNIKQSKFQRMCGKIRRILRQKSLQSEPLKFYKMVTYASENWKINRSDKRKMELAEMRFLRPVAGYTIPVQNETESELKISS